MEQAESNVFIAWSGDISKRIAKTLFDWLPCVIQRARPWMSEESILKGSYSSEKIKAALQNTTFGIICVTKDNMDKPWINFEAGAIGMKIGNDAFVCPYLFQIKQADIKGPFALFQMAEANYSDTCRLVESLNNALGNPITENILKKMFDKMWPELEQNLGTIAEEAKNEDATPPLRRGQDDKIDELLNLARGIDRRLSEERAQPILIYDPPNDLFGRATGRVVGGFAVAPPSDARAFKGPFTVKAGLVQAIEDTEAPKRAIEAAKENFRAVEKAIDECSEKTEYKKKMSKK